MFYFFLLPSPQVVVYLETKEDEQFKEDVCLLEQLELSESPLDVEDVLDGFNAFAIPDCHHWRRVGGTSVGCGHRERTEIE